jgi:hypothetical protein
MSIIRATEIESMTDRTSGLVSPVIRNLFPLRFWIQQKTWAVSLSLHSMYPLLSSGVAARTHYLKSKDHAFFILPSGV